MRKSCFANFAIRIIQPKYRISIDGNGRFVFVNTYPLSFDRINFFDRNARREL